MSGLRRVVEEERLIGRALYVVGQPGLALFQEHQVHLIEFEAGRHEPAAAIVSVGMLWKFRGIEQRGGRDGDAVVLDVGVQPIGGRAAGRAEEVVEPAMHGTVGDRTTEVGEPDTGELVPGAEPFAGHLHLVNRSTILRLESQAHVPLADGGGRVALFLEHPWQCEAIGFD